MPGHGMGDVYQEMREEIAGLKDENDRLARAFLERTGERNKAIIRAGQAEAEVARLRSELAQASETRRPTAGLTVNLDHEDLKRLVQKAVDKQASEIDLLVQLVEAVRALRDVQTGRITLHGRTEDHFYGEVDRILGELEGESEG